MMFCEKAKSPNAVPEIRSAINLLPYSLKVSPNLKNISCHLQRFCFNLKDEFIQVEIFNSEKGLKFTHNFKSLIRTSELITSFHPLDAFILGLAVHSGFSSIHNNAYKIYKKYFNFKKCKDNFVEIYQEKITSTYINGHLTSYLHQLDCKIEEISVDTICSNLEMLIDIGSLQAFHLGYNIIE